VNEMLLTKSYDQMEKDGDYKYLVRMPMDSVTEENVARLLKSKGDKEAELNIVKTTSIQQMWLGELDVLKGQYLEYKEDRRRLISTFKKGCPSGEAKSQKSKPGVKKNIIIKE